MKLKSCYWAVLAGSLLLQSCGGGSGGGLISGADKDKNPLNPTPGTADNTRLRPSETAATITTDTSTIYDAAKKPVLLRGINLNLGSNVSLARITGIKAIKETGSNVVHLYINENTTDPELEAALIRVVEQNLVAIITLEDPAKLTCSSNTAALTSAVDKLWLDKWLDVIAQDRFQPYIMINIASAWGPEGIFNPDSYGYEGYKELYKGLIGKFRNAGFKVPLVIDAPCGTDYNAFANDRGQELVSADPAKNIVLAVQVDGEKWNSSDKVTTAMTSLMEAQVPFVVTKLMGSAVGDAPIDHLDVIAKSAGDAALGLSFPWVSTSDKVAYVVALDKPTNLAGGSELSTNLYINAQYLEEVQLSDAQNKRVPTGKTAFALYMRDADGNTLNLGQVLAKDLRGYQWNKVRYPVPKAKEDINPNNLANGATTFDLTKVTHIGFEVFANGKAPLVGQAPKLKEGIKLDDLIILPGVPPLHVYKFDADTEGWGVRWGNPAVIAQSNGSLTILPKANELVFGPNVGAGEINFSKELEFTVRIKTPEGYNLNSLGGQVFGQFGSSWAWVSAPLQFAALKTGEWADWKFKVNFKDSVDASIISDPKDFGLQFWGLSGNEAAPLEIDSISVSDVNARPTKTITASQYKSSFTKNVNGYEVTWGGKSTVSVANGELLLTTPAGDGGAVNKADISSINEIDFKGGVTVSAKVFVPADYAANDLWMKFFFQDGNWNHFPFSPDLGLGSFTPGEWTSLQFTIKPEDFPAGFSRTLKPKMFGFQFANTVAGTIKFKDIEIVGQVTIDDIQPIFNLDFSDPAHFGAVKFDYAGGGFTKAVAESAGSASWKILPFGWSAATWFGAAADSAALNLSTAEDKVELTPRGEEVVNGTYGIKATSIPAAFK